MSTKYINRQKTRTNSSNMSKQNKKEKLLFLDTLVDFWNQTM